MKKSIIVIFSNIIFISVSAQTTFFKWYPTQNYEYIYNSIELSNGNFILSGNKGNNAYDVHQAYFVKLDYFGNIIAENNFPQSDTTSSHGLIFSLPNEAGFFNSLTTHYSFRNDTMFNFTSFNKFSTDDFSLHSQKIYFSPPNKYFPPQAGVLVADSEFYVIYQNSSYPTYFNTGSIVTKYNINFDSLASYVELQSFGISFGLLSFPKRNSLFQFQFVMGGHTYITELNRELQPVNAKTLGRYTSNVSATFCNDSVYLLTGTDINVGAQRNIKVRKYSIDNEIIDSVVYRNHPDTILFTGSVCNTAIIDNKIFVVGNYNIIPSEWPWQSSPTWIQVTRMDTNLTILDHHFYGGDAVYMPFKILKTADGGAFIAGNRYDHTKPWEKLYHVFALKVNEEGLITELPDHPEIKAHVAILYPNPGSDYMIIQSGPQVNGALFSLYDLQGRNLLTSSITESQTRLSATHLPSGTYVWQLHYNGKIIENGKWVKL
jgi:hypothetical protein